jgi:nitrogen fixation NifU-like protein
MYSRDVAEHFVNPRNVGTIENADGFGKASGGARCPEDMAYVWIRVDDDRIVEITHKTLGCPVAIAASSMTCFMAENKTLEEAEGITQVLVIEALGGVPEAKADSIVAVEALRQAIADYRGRGEQS